MGCIASKAKFVVNPNIPGQDESINEIMPLIGIDGKTVDMLYGMFHDIDVNSSGHIRPVDIFSYLNLDFNAFEKSIFHFLDADRSGKLNFLEFVCALWNFLTIPENQLGAFAYLIKEPTGALRVKYAEIKDSFDTIYGRKLDSSTSLQVIFHNLRDNYSPELSIQDVCKWSSMTGNSAILTPLVLLQLKLRKFIIGEKYWTTKTAERQSDEEMKKVEYIRKFQTIVKSKITAFKQRKDLEAKEKELNAKKLMGKAEANIARKQSILMESFQLKSPSKVAVSSPTPEEVLDETGKPVKDSSSKKLKPSRPQSASGDRANRPQSASGEKKEESMKAPGEKSLKREKSSRAEKSSKSSSKANLSSLDENVGTLEKQKSSRPESAKLEKKKSKREKKD